MHTRKIKYNKKEIEIIIRSDADDSVFNEIFIERDYKDLEPIIKNATQQIIDIGGHTGMFTIYARTLNPSVHISTYEPEGENFKILKKNLKRNHVKNVRAKNLAISDKEGEAVLYLSPDSHNHSLVQMSEKKHTTRTTTMEKIIKERTDLVKMDIEGAEFHVIEKAPEKTLKLIENIYIEYHQKSPSSITRKLQQAGFRTKTTPSHYDKNMGFISARKKDLFG